MAEELLDTNWICMLKRWKVEQGIHHPRVPHWTSKYEHPANLLDGTHDHCLPAPQWRGRMQKAFMINPPPKGYDIADRVYDLSTHLIPDFVNEDEDESSSEDESGSEDEVKVKKKKEGGAVDSENFVKLKMEFLDELQEYVEFVDVAKLLHSDERLLPFLHHVLTHEDAGIRVKGAVVITTMVQNNPTSQKLVIKEGGLKHLLQNFTSDPDATSRTKALGAISSLIRNNTSGMAKFRRESGYAALKNALISGSVCHGEVLNLIQYLLHENSSDRNIVTELGIPHIMMHLASSDKAEVREAALRGLLVLARDEEGGNNDQLVKNDDKLKQVLQERTEGISAMALDDLGAAREERQLVDSLWNACYNEPSSLGERGLLVLPGEDAPAPDVASKLFEPPLGACSAVEASDRNSVSEEKDVNIVTELGLPRIMIHLASSDDAEVREAALRGLLVLARNEEGGNSGQLVKNDKLKQVLQDRIEGISAMAPEDLGAAREERQLVDSLWNACYKKPSSLGEKGLLVLPGEDAPAMNSKKRKSPRKQLRIRKKKDQDKKKVVQT